MNTELKKEAIEAIEIVFILDKSGSMSGLENDTIGGYNSMLAKQKSQSDQIKVTTVLFDDKYVLLHDRVNIQNVNPITEKEYYVEGSTALLDAIGKTIQSIDHAHAKEREEGVAPKVLFIITTDGMENASSEYTFEKVKIMIEHQKEVYGWEFIYLGANIDAIRAAAKVGIQADRAANYHADSEGTKLNYVAVSEMISQFRTDKVSDNWKEQIDEDYNSRKSK